MQVNTETDFIHTGTCPDCGRTVRILYFASKRKVRFIGLEECVYPLREKWNKIQDAIENAKRSI